MAVEPPHVCARARGGGGPARPPATEIQEVSDAIGESHEDEWPPARPDEIPDDEDETEAAASS
jgi:hypothetical protein